MKVMKNEDIIRIVNKWQGAGFVHELTCGNDSRHEALVPEERNGKVILICPTCDYTQEYIPDSVLCSEEDLDQMAKKLKKLKDPT